MWAAEMSMRTVRSFATQHVKLQATESLLAIQRVGVGTGSAGDAGKAIVEVWKSQCEIDKPEKPRVRYTADQIRSMGLKVFGPKPASTS